MNKCSICRLMKLSNRNFGRMLSHHRCIFGLILAFSWRRVSIMRQAFQRELENLTRSTAAGIPPLSLDGGAAGSGTPARQKEQPMYTQRATFYPALGKGPELRD